MRIKIVNAMANDPHSQLRSKNAQLKRECEDLLAQTDVDSRQIDMLNKALVRWNQVTEILQSARDPETGRIDNICETCRNAKAVPCFCGAHISYVMSVKDAMVEIEELKGVIKTTAALSIDRRHEIERLKDKNKELSELLQRSTKLSVEDALELLRGEGES